VLLYFLIAYVVIGFVTALIASDTIADFCKGEGDEDLEGALIVAVILAWPSLMFQWIKKS
jgi:hypothetical protein